MNKKKQIYDKPDITLSLIEMEESFATGSVNVGPNTSNSNLIQREWEDTKQEEIDFTF